MCNNPVYHFFIATLAASREAYPLYDSLKKVARKADGEEYYRETLDGELSFVRDDYSLIAAASIEERILFTMYIEDEVEGLKTYFEGYFLKTDCSFDVDECGAGIVNVSITPVDYYDSILGGMDKEFNLIELAPPTTPVNIKRQPIVQIYCYGAAYLNNYLNGTWWEQAVTSPVTSNAELENDYFFTLAGEKIFIPGAGAGLSPDVSGEYIRTGPGLLVFDRDDGEYRLQYKTSSPLLVEIKHIASGAQVYAGNTGEAMFAGAPGGGFAQDAFGGGAVLTSVTDSSSQVQPIATSFFVRILTNHATVGGSPTEDVPENDIVPPNANYTKVIGIDADNFYVSDANNTTGGRFRRFDAAALHFPGNYFDKPSPGGSTKLYPVSSSNWLHCSYWFEFDAGIEALQEDAGDDITLRDAYKLSDALAAVLGELNPAVSHQEDAAYSAFLYGSGNPVRGAVKYPLISPKSNVILGEYDKPAQVAKIKLTDIRQYLWAAYRAKWHIDSSGRFRIEHISYYDNGGSYSGPNIGVDLTALIEPQTGENWEYGAGRWEYEKANMPERIEPGWMDNVSEPFNGYPISIRSAFVQKGNIESQKAALFTTDVDFILSQGADISKDGFVGMDAILSGTEYALPFVEIESPAGDRWVLQNGYLAFLYIHPTYCRHGLPAPLITMNQEDTTALSVTRRKIQKLEYPAMEITDYLALVTTGQGDGKVLEFRQDVDGGYIEATIAHDTE